MAVVKSQLEHLCSTFNIESAESIGLQMQSYIEEVRPTKKNNTHLHLDRNSFRLGPFNWCPICVVIQHWVQCGYSNDASFHLVRYLCFMYIYSVIIARTWMNRASIRTHVACSSFIKKKNSPFNEPVDGYILWLMTWWHCLSVLIWDFPERFQIWFRRFWEEGQRWTIVDLFFEIFELMSEQMAKHTSVNPSMSNCNCRVDLEHILEDKKRSWPKILRRGVTVSKDDETARELNMGPSMRLKRKKINLIQVSKRRFAGVPLS